MAEFDLFGRILMQDNFSAVFSDFIAKAEQAQDAAGGIDDKIDAASARQRLQEIEQELDRLRQKAARGIELSVGEVERVRALSVEARRLRAGLEEVADSAGRSRSGFQKLMAVAVELNAAMGALLGAFAVRQLIGFGMELVRVGAQAQLVAQIYENLADRVGIAGDQLIQELSRAARGTIDQTRLMIIANRAILAGGRELASQLPRLLEIARAASLATGQDINFVFETLVRGIVKASPLLIDNADIYIKIGDAVERWAQRQGKAVDQLSETERRVAIANAVLEQGSRFIEQMGLSAETAADRIQSLPAAIEDLKSAAGELTVLLGAADMVEELTNQIRGAEAAIGGFKDLIDALQRAAEQQAAGLARSAAGLQAQAQGTLDLAAIADQAFEQLAHRIGLSDRQIDQLRDTAGRLGLGFELLATALTNPARLLPLVGRAAGILAQDIGALTGQAEESLPVWDGWMARLDDYQRQLAEAHERQRLFNEAFSRARADVAGVGQAVAQLGQLAGQLSIALERTPEFPQIGRNLATIDTAGLRDLLERVRELDPELTDQIDRTLEYVDAVEREQAALIEAARATRDNVEALRFLAREAFGSSAGIEDLIRNYDRLAPAVRRAIDELADVRTILRILREEAAQPIEVDIRMRGLESTRAQIDRMMLQLAGLLSPDQIRALRERALLEFDRFFQDVGQVGEFEFELLQRQFLQGWEGITDDLRRKLREMQRAAEEGAQGMFQSAGELRGAIERALRTGLEVTPEDFIATAAGTYEDKALEAARRLQAIAERGFAEIKAHPDWVALLKIPPEVLAGSEEELKAWAARTKRDVEELARPDLIDWDAFLENFRRLQERAAARELTIDIAVEKLEAAGLLRGSREEVRRQVAQALGLAEPSITLETLFEVPAESAESIIEQILAGRPALPVPVQPVLTAPATEEGGGAETLPEGEVIVPTQIEVIPGAEAEAQGARAAEAILSGFEAAIAAQDPAIIVVDAWADAFAARAQEFAQIGESIGEIVIRAFLRALEEGAGEARMVLARAIAPEVVAIIRRDQGGRRALP